MTAKGSSLSLDVRAPDMPGNFRFYYNNDFFGSGSGMDYRLKQLYGQFYNVTAGFTYSIFEDPDVWPDTVDFEGPNSVIFARQATVRYMVPLNDQWQLNFGVEAAGVGSRYPAALPLQSVGQPCARRWLQHPLGGCQAGPCATRHHLPRCRCQQPHVWPARMSSAGD